MKSKMIAISLAATLFAALAPPVRVKAQDQEKVHPGYRLVDVGTLGGPQSAVFEFAHSLNRGTAAVGGHSTPDPYPLFCINGDCFVSRSSPAVGTT